MEGFCFTLEKVAGPFLMSVVSGVVGGLIVYKMLDKKFNQFSSILFILFVFITLMFFLFSIDLIYRIIDISLNFFCK